MIRDLNVCSVGEKSIWCIYIYACTQMLTLIIEAIDTVDGGALMVSPQEEEILRVFDLIGQ